MKIKKKIKYTIPIQNIRYKILLNIETKKKIFDHIEPCDLANIKREAKLAYPLKIK